MQTREMIGTHRKHRTDEGEYRFYMMLFFPVAFLTVLIRRLLPRSHGPRPGDLRHPAFFSEVMELTRSTVPWVFMGR